MYRLKARREYLPFSHAEEQLAEARNYWICTARPDGRPHSIPVWGFWIDRAPYLGTARASRKARNLAHNPAPCWPGLKKTSPTTPLVGGSIFQIRNRAQMQGLVFGFLGPPRARSPP
jgi:Pyridoxamine 5'-phosphate oxidase